MGVPTSEVGYTIVTTRRETTKVHKNMWWLWGEDISKYGLVCVPSTAVTNSQNLSPVTSAELSLNTVSTVLPFDTSTKEMTAPRLLKKISPFLKILEEKRKTARGNKSNIREIESVNSLTTAGPTSLENAEKEVNKSIYNQETSEDSENDCFECWENCM